MGKDEVAFQREFEQVLGGARGGVADFTGFIFPNANYAGREFKAYSVFSRATFAQKADFKSATFADEAVFMSARFMQNADFGEVTFAQKAHFFGVKFAQNADFGKTTFARKADFERTVFTQKADFRQAKFAQDTGFNKATFTHHAHFGGATFAQKADFAGATFTQDANFFAATFVRDANFGNAVFTQRADFERASFVQNAYFGGAAFTGNARFENTAFAEEGKFGGATFTQDAYFVDSTFTQSANFARTTFAQNAIFARTTFTKLADFERARFLGGAYFRETKFRKDEQRSPGAVFLLAEFSRPEAIVFYKTYLGQVMFHNCDVSRFNFSLVEWRRRKDSGRRMVFEEIVNLDDETTEALRPGEGDPDERNYGLIAELYQQLKKNYDERKDYWTAGDFHYGEMEMKRLHSRGNNRWARWLYRNHGLVAWYKYASRYGESYVRPASVFLIVIAVFTLLFPLAGLERNENVPPPAASASQVATVSELSYRHFDEFIRTYPGRKWIGAAAFFGNSLMTVLSVAGFQKELKYEPSYPWGRALALLELLLTSTLIALFLLAVRRSFKR
jgi:hypothetical protein